jgi:enamine deaminase RidA (YjgF/YER057c/UK114 family)
MQEVSTIDYPRAAGLPHNPAYSQVVSASGKRTVYVAGQISVDEHGKVVGAGDLAAQTTQVMKNLGLALAAAGASFAEVVKITTYVVNYKPEDRAVIGKARSPFFADGTPPASTLVGVASLAVPEWLIEIEAIAVVD